MICEFCFDNNEKSKYRGNSNHNWFDDCNSTEYNETGMSKAVNTN